MYACGVVPFPFPEFRVNRSLVPIASLLLIAGVALGEGVVLRPELSAGREMTYRLSRTLDIEQTQGETKLPATHASLDLTFRLSVVTVRADGSAELGMSVLQMSVRSDAPPGGSPFTFDWSAADEKPADDKDKPGAEPPAKPEPDAADDGDADGDGKVVEHPMPGVMFEHDEQKKDDKADSERIARLFTKFHPRLEINAEGELSAINGLDLFAGSSKQKIDDPALRMLHPQVLGASLRPLLNPGHPEPVTRAFKAGDTWTSVREISMGPIGTLQVSEQWTMADAPGAATARTTVTATASKIKGRVAPQVSIVESSGGGALAWDIEQHRLRSHELSLHIATHWTLGDLSVDSKQDSTTKLKIVE